MESCGAVEAPTPVHEALRQRTSRSLTFSDRIAEGKRSPAKRNPKGGYLC